MKSFLVRRLFYISLFAILPNFYSINTLAQSVSQNAPTESQVEGDFNNIIQVPNQNNAQNRNVNEIDISYIAPLVSPPNTENDLGFNFSVGINDIQTTWYLGVIYQPGRSSAHKARMRHLEEQIKLLETQNKIAEAELSLLQRQLQD